MVNVGSKFVRESKNSLTAKAIVPCSGRLIWPSIQRKEIVVEDDGRR